MKWTEPYNANVTVKKSTDYRSSSTLVKQLPGKGFSDGGFLIVCLIVTVLFTLAGAFMPVFFEYNIVLGIIDGLFIALAFFGWCIFFGGLSDIKPSERKYFLENSKSDSIDVPRYFEIQSKWLKYSIYQDAINGFYDELKWAQDNGIDVANVHNKWLTITRNLNKECARLEQLQIERLTESRFEVERDFVMEMQAFVENMSKGISDA